MFIFYARVIQNKSWPLELDFWGKYDLFERNNHSYFLFFLAIGGESTVSINQYPNAFNKQLKVRGYYTQFPGRKSLKACSTNYGPTENGYEIFISNFRLAIPFKYKEEVETNHISMHKYLLDESAGK